MYFQLFLFSWNWLLNGIYQTTQAKVFLWPANEFNTIGLCLRQRIAGAVKRSKLMWFLFPVDAFDRWLRPLWSISYLNHSLFSFTALHRKYFLKIQDIFIASTYLFKLCIHSKTFQILGLPELNNVPLKRVKDINIWEWFSCFNESFISVTIISSCLAYDATKNGFRILYIQWWCTCCLRCYSNNVIENCITILKD